MIKNGHILLSCIIIVCGIWVACEKERDPCLQPIVNPIRIGIYQPADTGSIGRDSVLPSAILGLEDSQAIRYYGANLSKFSLILSPVADSVRWYIVPDTNNRDNRDLITFYYERQPHFISAGCGYTYYFKLKNVTSSYNFIDSIKIVNPLISNDAKVEHVKIFY